MQQSNFIFGALAVAFLVFITVRGSLPVYLSVIFGTAEAPSAGDSKESGDITSPDFVNPLNKFGFDMGQSLRNLF